MASTGSFEARDFKPIEASKFQPIDLATVNRKLNYNVALQFGAMAHWRKYGGRQRRVEQTVTKGKVNQIHDPKVVYVDEAIGGKELAGLVQSHNDWIEANRTKNHEEWVGHVDRQIMVLGFEVSTALPPEYRKKKVDGDFLVGIVSSLVSKKFDEESKSKSNTGKS